jgi:hypothetical protein
MPRKAAIHYIEFISIIYFNDILFLIILHKNLGLNTGSETL